MPKKADPLEGLELGSPIGGVDADGGRTEGAKAPDAEGVDQGTPAEAPVNQVTDEQLGAEDGPLPDAPPTNGPLGSKENPIQVQTVPAGAGTEGPTFGSEVEGDQIARTAQGNEADVQTADSAQFQKNVTNVDLAPMPRDQIDEDYTIDPMKRQPGDAPDPAAAAQAIADEAGDGSEEYVMTMAYWDGVQMHPQGSVLRFKPEDAPYLAKPVKR